MNTKRATQTRVGLVLSARLRSCATCGSDQVHSLVRSGVRRFLRWGPPAYCIDQYAFCTTCQTRQPLDGWFDGTTEATTVPLALDLVAYEQQREPHQELQTV